MTTSRRTGWGFEPSQWIGALVVVVGGSFVFFNWVSSELRQLEETWHSQLENERMRRRDLDQRFEAALIKARDIIRTIEAGMLDREVILRRLDEHEREINELMRE